MANSRGTMLLEFTEGGFNNLESQLRPRQRLPQPGERR